MTHVCRHCREEFVTRKSVSRYCSMGCYHAAERLKPNTGTFLRGGTPINKEPVGSVSVRRRRNRTEGPRAWVKVAEPNVWVLRATVNWQAYNGPIPVGHVVHHINRDTLDDSITNLALITRAEHLAEHRPEWRRS